MSNLYIVALKAIKARMDGVFDNPCLLSFGPLTDKDSDIRHIIDTTLSKNDDILNALQTAQQALSDQLFGCPSDECSTDHLCSYCQDSQKALDKVYEVLNNYDGTEENQDNTKKG